MNYTILIFLIVSTSVFAQPVKEVRYLKNIFGHVHQNTSAYSTSMSTLTCGHPIKIVQYNTNRSGWYGVLVGDKSGYMQSKMLSKTRPNCFQVKYPKFVSSFELDLSEMYYWGKLYDQYVEGKSEVK